MKTICPNCKREDTMNYDATWGVCNACGWRGNPSAFGWNLEEALKEDFPDDDIMKEWEENIKNDHNKPFFHTDIEPEPVEEPPKPKKGERLHTMYEDENGNIVVGDDW
jgi:hypothetical protein